MKTVIFFILFAGVSIAHANPISADEAFSNLVKSLNNRANDFDDITADLGKGNLDALKRGDFEGLNTATKNEISAVDGLTKAVASKDEDAVVSSVEDLSIAMDKNNDVLYGLTVEEETQGGSPAEAGESFETLGSSLDSLAQAIKSDGTAKIAEEALDRNIVDAIDNLMRASNVLARQLRTSDRVNNITDFEKLADGLDKDAEADDAVLTSILGVQ